MNDMERQVKAIEALKKIEDKSSAGVQGPQVNP